MSRHRGVAALGALLVIAVPTSAQPPDPRLQRSWQLSHESDQRRLAGDLASAERLAREAAAICPELGRLEPFCLVPSRQRLAAAALAQGELGVAEQLYRETLAVAEANYPSPSPWHVQLRQNLATVLGRQDRPADVEAVLRPAIRGAIALAGQHPEMLPSIFNALAVSLFAQQRWRESEEAAGEAVRVLEAGNRRADATYDVARINRADALQRLGREVEAEVLVAAVLAEREARMGSDHRDLSVPLQRLAGLKGKRGQAAEATALSERAVALLRRPPAAAPADLAEALNGLGVALDGSGRLAEAATAYAESLAFRETAGDRASTALASTLANFGNVHVRQERPDEAEPLLRRALALRDTQSPPDEQAIAGLLLTLGFVLRDNQRADEAAAVSARLDGIASRLPPTDIIAIRAGHLRGDAALRHGRAVEAAAILLETRNRLAALRRPADPDMPAVLGSLAIARATAGDYAGAVESYAAIENPAPGTLVGFAQALGLAGRPAEAIERLQAAARSTDIFVAAQAHFALATLADRGNDRAEAEARLLDMARLLDQSPALAEPRRRTLLLSELANYATGSRRPSIGVEVAARAVAAAEASPPDRLLLDALRIEAHARADMGDTDGARRALERQFSLARTIYPAGHPRLAGVYTDLAAHLWAQARYAEAAPLAAQATAIFEAARLPRDVANARSLGAMAALGLGQLAEAEAGFRSALEAANAASPRPTTVQRDILLNLSSTLRRSGQIGAAVSVGRQSLAMAEALDSQGQLATAPMLNVLALALLAAERPGEAIPLFRRSLALRQGGLEPKDPELARGYLNLGSALFGQGEIAEAAPLIERGAILAEGAVGPRHPDLVDALAPLAALRALTGQTAEAEALRRRSLAILEAALGPHHPSVGVALNALSGAAIASGRADQAITLSTRALEIVSAVRPALHPQVIDVRVGLGQALLAAGRPGAAEREFGTALRAAELRGEDGRLDVVAPLLGLAQSQNAVMRSAAAMESAQSALTIVEAALGPAHPMAGAIRMFMADTLNNAGSAAEAERLYRAEIAARQARLPAGAPALEGLRLALAELLAEQGRNGEAAAIAAAATASLEARLAPRDPRRANLASAASRLAAWRGDIAEAERLAAAAIGAHEMAGLPADAARAALLRRHASTLLSNGKVPEASRALAAARAIAGPERTGADAAEDAQLGAAIATWAGRMSEAETELARYRTLLAAADPSDRLALASAFAITGRLRIAQRRMAGAVQAFEAALAEATAANPRTDRPQVAFILLGLADAYEGARRGADAERTRVRAIGILGRIGWTGQPTGRWL